MSLVMELIEYSLVSKWQSPVIRFQIWYILTYIIGTFLLVKYIVTEVARL